MTVSKRLRFEILRRDNHACRYCGAAAPDVKLTVDHVLPVALGGQDDSTNLVTACAPCNSGKSSTTPGAPLVEEVDRKALMWADAMRQVAEEREAQRDYLDGLHSEFESTWTRWGYTDYQGNRQSVPLPDGWATSITRFHSAGLTYFDFEELIDAAMSCKTAKDKFRYFCGCCWTRIRQSQNRASEIVAGWEEQDGR